MIQVLLLLAVFLALLLSMALAIRGRKPRVVPRIGMYVHAVRHPPFPSESGLDSGVTGEVIGFFRNGCIQVRDWETGDVHVCLNAGAIAVKHDEAAVMRKLRAEADEEEALARHAEKRFPQYEVSPSDTRTPQEIREAFRKAEENPNCNLDTIH